MARARVSRVLLVRGEATEVTEAGDPGLWSPDSGGCRCGGRLRPRRARAARLGVRGPTSSGRKKYSFRLF